MDKHKNRLLLRKAHVGSSITATLCILLFWVSTVIVELAGSPADIALVKKLIVFALIILIPSIITTAFTGNRLARNSKHKIVKRKQIRMKFIGANGVLVLVPCAIALFIMSQDLTLSVSFYGIQAVELVAGGTNLILMSLNIRDGIKLSRRK